MSRRRNPFLVRLAGLFGVFAGLVAAAPAAVAVTPVYRLVASFDGVVGTNSAAGLARGSDGRLYGTNYGTTAQLPGPGRVFRVEADGSLATVHAFADDLTEGYGARGTLLPAPDGWLYGTTSYGGSGANAVGTVYRVHPDGRFESLRTFHKGDAGNVQEPYGSLSLGPDGRLYGASRQGGSGNHGTLYALTTDGRTLAVLHRFTGADGDWPFAGPVFGPDGRLYGTTFYGGATDQGVLYAMGTDGTYQLVHSFGCAEDGCGSSAPLVVGPDGRLYGTTQRGGVGTGGTAGVGVVFRLEGTTVRPMHVFAEGAPEGQEPHGGLSVGPDRGLYGATSYGGTGTQGTLFRMDTTGRFAVVHAFSGPDGAIPLDPPAFDPTLGAVGVTWGGGAAGVGAVYSVTRKR